jgi:hypothetical protein
MAVCDRIAVLDRGKIVCVDTPGSISRHHRDILAESGLDFRPYLDLIGEFD